MAEALEIIGVCCQVIGLVIVLFGALSIRAHIGGEDSFTKWVATLGALKSSSITRARRSVDWVRPPPADDLMVKHFPEDLNQTVELPAIETGLQVLSPTVGHTPGLGDLDSRLAKAERKIERLAARSGVSDEQFDQVRAEIELVNADVEDLDALVRGKFDGDLINITLGTSLSLIGLVMSEIAALLSGCECSPV